jgi:hypothetical protein
MGHIFDLEQMDPYVILSLAYTATESEIQEAFQKKLEGMDKHSEEAHRLIEAYGMIRNPSGRERFRWEEMRSFLADPFHEKDGKGIDLVPLVRELAFLSLWELGDDACLS